MKYQVLNNILIATMVSLFCTYLLSGCGPQANTEYSEPVDEWQIDSIAPINELNVPAYPDEIDKYLAAYTPWQLALAREMGISDQRLREYAKYFLGTLEWYNSSLNAPLPPQSTLDEFLLDTLLEYYNHFSYLRNEMAVLITEQRGDIYYSFVVQSGEGIGPVLVAWEMDGDDIRILELRADSSPHSIPPARPTLEYIAGEYVMFSLLKKDAVFGGDYQVRLPVYSALFSVTMGDGTVIRQDVSELPCIMVFLPEGDYVYWALTDLNGVLIWDSLESTWGYKCKTAPAITSDRGFYEVLHKIDSTLLTEGVLCSRLALHCALCAKNPACLKYKSHNG